MVDKAFLVGVDDLHELCEELLRRIPGPFDTVTGVTIILRFPLSQRRQRNRATPGLGETGGGERGECEDGPGYKAGIRNQEEVGRY